MKPVYNCSNCGFISTIRSEFEAKRYGLFFCDDECLTEYTKNRNPYNVQLRQKVIVNKGNWPILTVSNTIGSTVLFDETTDSCLISECSPFVKVFYNGGFTTEKMTAQDYDKNRDYIGRIGAVVSLI